MARKKLKNWIDDLTNQVGTIDNTTMKGELVTLAALADALESGQSAVEADAQISALENTVEELKPQIKYIESQ